jgi:hypothetical protein
LTPASKGQTPIRFSASLRVFWEMPYCAGRNRSPDLLALFHLARHRQRLLQNPLQPSARSTQVSTSAQQISNDRYPEAAQPSRISLEFGTEPIVSFQDLPLSLVDCRTRPGQSCSPVIAYRNRGLTPTTDGGATDFGYPAWQFLGIYSGRINAESDLGMLWKAQALAQLIDSM